MTAEDRQAINRMIQHKREEFESVIYKGVVAMLNTIEENKKLASERYDYLNFLTTKNQQTKAHLSDAINTVKDATSNAPMGAGSAAQLTLTATNAIGGAILDNAEERRQVHEAEQRFFSAQMLYYIPSQDYEKIAMRVAGILSYRYQFLIFRLGVGENGYIKLANFFIKSMKTYAIARLREQKQNPVRALINAAIPPSTDALSYRDWPNVDCANFRTNFRDVGKRKRLELDEDANDILKRCGPAVRALLGGNLSYIDFETGRAKSYQACTILGALNHAPILNTHSQVIAGLQPRHRRQLHLDGNMKYPFILLGAGETTADLGVNFATKTTSEILEDVHIEVLRRLVPDFFTHQVCYSLETEVESKQTGIADIKYPEEKLECPWTKARDIALQGRFQELFNEKPLPVSALDLESDEKILRLKAIQFKSHQLNLEARIADAEIAYKDLMKAIYDIGGRFQALKQERVCNNMSYIMQTMQVLQLKS